MHEKTSAQLAIISQQVLFSRAGNVAKSCWFEKNKRHTFTPKISQAVPHIPVTPYVRSSDSSKVAEMQKIHFNDFNGAHSV